MNFLRNLVPTALRATPGAGLSPAFAAARSLLGGVRWMGMTRPGIKKWKRIRRIRRRIKKGSGSCQPLAPANCSTSSSSSSCSSSSDFPGPTVL